MPIVSVSNSDIEIINPDVTVNYRPVHGSSSGTAQQNLEAILNEAIDGDIIGGDFNVNFLETSTLEALATILNKKGLKIDISDDSVNSLTAWFKMRSANSLYSQQLMKNGTPDVFLKDLSFKLVKKTGDEPSIPDSLLGKLGELESTRQYLIRQITKLKGQNNFNDHSIRELCSSLGVINFHDLEESFGNDHASTYYYDADSDTLCYAINSIQHKAYNFDDHFNDIESLDLKAMGELYYDLDKCVLKEAYKLFAKRDQVKISSLDELSNEHLKMLVASQLKESNTLSNKTGTITLSKIDVSVYFKNILCSPELSKVNATLKAPYSLQDDAFVEQRLELLLSEKNLKAYAESISKIINAMYQALDPSRPKEGEQTIALSGNGFPAFTDDSGKLIPVEDIEKIQLTQLEAELRNLQEHYPTAKMSVAVIEGKEQPEKCDAIRTLVNQINIENLAAREKNENFFFYLSAGLSVATACVYLISGALENLSNSSMDAIPTAGISALLVTTGVTAGLAYCGFFNKEKSADDQEKPHGSLDLTHSG